MNKSNMINDNNQRTLTQQEIDDIKLVSNSTFFDRTYAELPPERKTEAVSRAAVRADSLYLKDVPKNILSDELILEALRDNGELISDVGFGRRTPEMYATALANSGLALRSFPLEMITPEVAMKAVQNNGMALEFLPEHLKTPDMCRAALSITPRSVCQDYEIIQHIPFPEVCMERLKEYEKSQSSPFMAFGGIRPAIVTPEMADLAVKLDAACFTLVPERLKTPERCMEAVKACWTNLMFVPEKRITRDLCDIALKSSPLALAFMPERLKTSDFYMGLVRNNGLILQHIPEKDRMPEICTQAVMNSSQATEFVPEKILRSANMYTLWNKMEKCTSGNVGNCTFDQVQRVFNGETLKMTGKHFLNSPPCDYAFRYNQQTNQLVFVPLKKKEVNCQIQPKKKKGIKM